VKYMGYVKSSVGSSFLLYILILCRGSEIKVYIGLEAWKLVNNVE
jgi:hypothetical protein